MLKKVMPLVAVILLSACAHGMSGTCTHCGTDKCKCEQSACKCSEGKGVCTPCKEKATAEKEAMGDDCPKCREAERYNENKRYNN